jgi:hypothetical protein
MDYLLHSVTKVFVQVVYHCQGSKGLEMKTIRTLVLVIETSECRIQFKISWKVVVNSLENNSSFKLRS